MARSNPIVQARKDGYNDAIVEIRRVVFDYLEKKYMDKSVERGTPRADLLLEVTRELSALLEKK